MGTLYKVTSATVTPYDVLLFEDILNNMEGFKFSLRQVSFYLAGFFQRGFIYALV